MTYYTSQPAFLNNVVPPDILFVLDISEAMLPAAYGNYPKSHTNSTGIFFISSNVAVSTAASKGKGATPGGELCNTNSAGTPPTGCPATIGTADTFVSSKEYFGMFNPKRCYIPASPKGFAAARTTDKASTTPCPNSTEWDGNFLNWLTMRKIDVAKKALVGGNGLSAQCNNSPPFDCRTLLTETQTGGGGSVDNCTGNGGLCYAYVKAFGTSAYPPVNAVGQYYYPSSLPVDTSSKLTYVGVTAGNLYAADSGDWTAIVGMTAANTFAIQVDLTSETTAVQAEQSTGLFQNLRYDQMRVAVMLANTNGTAGSVTMYFDQKLTPSITNNIRNQKLGLNAPLAESLYEALCYFNQSQKSGCYSNTPNDYTATPSAAGDPYYFCKKDGKGDCATPVTGQMVPCCKGYVLMISSGIPTNDGGSPTAAQFGDLMTLPKSGPPTQLANVAYYGKQNDLRSDLAKTQHITFYSVNAMGGSAGAALLASASKWGGFEDSNANKIPDDTGAKTACMYPPGSNLGTPGTLGNSSDEWDRDPYDCEPDTYFDASEGEQLEKKILAAVQSILKKSASGTAASVLASSSTGEGAMYQAYFYPTDPHAASVGNDVIYTGYTTSFFIDSFGNFREDTDGDGRMVYGVDDIVRLRYDTTTEEVMVERYKDEKPADGITDTPTAPYYSKPLKDTTVLPLWEAGDSLADLDSTKSCSTADAGKTCRRIWTWIDTDNDGLIDSTENMEEFIPTNARLAPYLNAGKSSLTATQVINFIRGCDPKDCPEQASLRDRHITTVAGATKLWKLGDPINSTPTVVGAPRERYDLIYGDLSYTAFYQRYKSRRQVVYLGANDGMLHAFNAGFYNKGDDPATTTTTEHGWFTTNSTSAPTSGTPRNDPPRGAELWAYIPYSLLPQLQWLARTDYVHSYYVDLKPKVTDVRIFTDDGPTGRHPGGWGTILISGFRLGGSCGNCTTADGAPPMTFTATFEKTSEDRSFYSGYFIMDITDPEQEPELIAVFTNRSGLGLTTSYPTVLRVNTKALSDKADNTNAKWFAVFGSGMTGYKGTTNLNQQSQFYTLELRGDKTSTAMGPINTGDRNAFMGDLISVDANLDYRVDAIYGGNTICNDSTSPASCSGAGGSLTPNWIGKMYRFTTGDGIETDPAKWTLPSVVVQEFSCTPLPCTGANKVGPITGAPSITSDDSNNVWVFFGTGRYWDPIADKANTDTQYFIGIKDQVPRGICKLSSTDCQLKDLEDMSKVVVCSVCTTITQVSGGPSGATTFDALVKGITSKEGWYTTLPTAGERALSSPTLLGGTLLFTTFVPSADMCVVQGTGSLYALFYLTGSAYPDPLVGTTVSGQDVLNNRSVSLGTGLPSSVAVQLTKQGSGTVGGTDASPCSGGLNAVIQGSTGEVHQVCGKPALSAWSRYLSWMNNRDS